MDECKTQEEANQKIRDLYTLRTGKNPEEEAQKFLTVFCQGFMAEYKKDNPS